MKITSHRFLASVAGLAIVAIAAPAHAQDGDAGANADEAAPGEIIVTAQKRAERLQDVPLAITAVSAETLENKGITDTKNLAAVAPSLTYTQGNNPSNSTFRIRGIGTQVFGQGGESSVSTVIDGVVLARQGQGFADLADIERIEVLRGPQGTLFGKNATGGVISVVTADPGRELAGKITASVAEQGEYHIRGTVTAPLGEAVSARLSGFYNNDDGYIRNVALKRKTNGYESWGMRGKLMFDLGSLNLLLSGDYDKNTASCCQQVAIRTDNANLAKLQLPVVAGPHNTQVSSNLDTVSDTESQVYFLRGKYDLGGAEITSITAYQKWKFNNNVDVDALYTPAPIFTGGNGAAPQYAQFEVNGGPVNLHQVSQELRIGSTGDNRFNYTVGLYYEDLHLLREFTRRIVTCPTANALNAGLTVGAVCPAPAGSSGSHHAVLDSQQYAAFGQFDFRLTDGLKALAGFRAQHQKMKVDGHQIAGPAFAGDAAMFSGGSLTSGVTRASDDAFTYKLGLQYEFSRNAQAYLTYGTGYKGQSLGTEFNQTFNNNPVVEPEKVKAWEIGFKGSTADRTLSFAVAAFLADYRNLQVQANRSDQSTGNFLFVVTNAGKAQTKGIELEATVRPDDHFSVAMSAVYVRARFDADGIACPLQFQNTAPTIAFGAATPINTCYRATAQNGSVSGRVQDVRGGILPNTPEWRVNLNPRYETPVGSTMLGYLDFNLAFQSDVGFALEQDPLLQQDGYVTMDATIGVRPDGGKGLSASLWVKNLGEQRYYTGMGHGSTLTAQNLTPNNLTGFLPKTAFRTFGATVGYSF